MASSPKRTSRSGRSQPTSVTRWGWQFMIGTLLGLAALGWTLRDIEWASVRQSMAQVSALWLTLAVLSVIVVTLTKAIRWQVLFGDTTPLPSVWQLFSVLAASQMINIIIPIRTGELTRVGFLSQAGYNGATTVSTLVVEKALDLLAVGLIAMSLVGLAVGPLWLRESAVSVFLIGLILILGLAVAWWGRAWLELRVTQLLTWKGWLPVGWQTRIVTMVRAMLNALGMLTNLRLLSLALFWTLLGWLLPIGTMLALLWAFALPIPFLAAVVLMLSLTLSYVVPSLPGRIGVRHATVVLILGQYGIGQAQANGFAIVLNIATLTPLLLMGGLGLWFRTMSLLPSSGLP